MGKKRRPPTVPPLPPFLLAADDKPTTILRAAATLFLRDGYSNTSVDAVTAEAGVSKATVYAHFPSKEALFEALVKGGTAASFSQFPPLARGGGDPVEELSAFLEPVLDHILVRGAYAWDRLIIAEAVRHPQLARLFRENALERLRGVMEDYLRALAAESPRHDQEPGAAAEALLSLAVLGPLHDVLLLGPGLTEHLPRMRYGVRLVVRQFRPI